MRLRIAVVIVIIGALTACRGSSPETPAAAPTDTPIPAPTFTPTPSNPLAILVVPGDMDQETSNLYQQTVYDLAQASGFRFQVRNHLAPEDVADSTLKIAIILPPDPGLQSLAATAPHVQFLAVNLPDVPAGANISTLASEGQVEIPAFLAGYIAAMITEDFHIGMLATQGDPSAGAAFAAFQNGMRYFCGLCQPFYYVPWTFPQYSEVPPDKIATECGGYANQLLVQYKVYALYFFGDVATSECLNYVGTQGAMLIGTSMPQPRPGGWVVTIQPDPIKAIQVAWPALVAGEGGNAVQSPLGLADADATLLTAGKERLAQQALDDLLAGRLLPGNP